MGDKNTQLNALCARFGVDLSVVSLADDDPHNIAKACAGTDPSVGPDPNFAKISLRCSGARPLHVWLPPG